MWQIYLLDISGNLKVLGGVLLFVSVVLIFIGGMVFDSSNDYKRSDESFTELRSISGYIFIMVFVFIILGVVMTTLTPSRETSKNLIDQIKIEKGIE